MSSSDREDWDGVFQPGRASLPGEERSSEIEARLRLNVETPEVGEDRKIGATWALILFVILVFALVAGCLWYAWIGIWP